MKGLATLGYAGLIPFVTLPLLFVFPLWLSSEQILELYFSYSAMILAFMAGVLWPVLHNHSQKSAKLATIAVLFPVLSFIALLPGRDYFLLFQAALFVLLRQGEFWLGINRLYNAQYNTLRNRLTVVVVVSHVTFNWLVNHASY